MTSFGRMTAALASATNELTVAAANFNFDFSVMKFEAPSEFHPLGRGLSDQRREDAENGIPHVTAQKLGALFKDIPPATPNLVRAYGKRVSEISQLPTTTSLSQHTPSSVFAGHAGPDGTSIWAAATSGPGALPIQLLTCMLARLWNGPEATSVWVELVKERKLEIERRCEGGESLDFGMLMATRQTISRAQLAEWDASARAWLRTADEAKKIEQTRLILIIDKLNIPVNHDMRVYSSVIEAWKTALKSLECMVLGMPQSLHEHGAILLGLSAWHLYPDLLILSGLEQAEEVNMKDLLIPKGGVLTIGLQREIQGDAKGIYWSLSLAHLRYYGKPILSERNFARDSSRISFEQLLQVAMGSLSVCWERENCGPLDIAKFFTAIGDLLDRTSEVEGPKGREQAVCAEFRRLGPNWLQTLITTAGTITDASGLERDTILRLLNVGSKYGKNFLLGDDRTGYLDTVFGLCDISTLFQLLKGCEPRIRILRQLATRYGFNHGDTIIRYTTYPEVFDSNENEHEEGEITGFSRSTTPVEETSFLQENLMSPQRPAAPVRLCPLLPAKNGSLVPPFEYASAIAQSRPSTKRGLTGEECTKSVYQRWLKKEDFLDHNHIPKNPLEVCDCIGVCREGFCACFRRNMPCNSGCQTSTPNVRYQDCENTQANRLYLSRLSKLQAAGEECFIVEDNNFK